MRCYWRACEKPIKASAPPNEEVGLVFGGCGYDCGHQPHAPAGSRLPVGATSLCGQSLVTTWRLPPREDGEVACREAALGQRQELAGHRRLWDALERLGSYELIHEGSSGVGKPARTCSASMSQNTFA
jgi:hypothetical protein